jgi:hypothetical protein
VCNLCGDRLDKCMECRTPLFMTIPRPQNQTTISHSRTPSYRTPRQPPSPPVPPVKKRLPLPKNVVLLSLIEATELATEDATSKNDSSPRNTRNGVAAVQDDGDSDDRSVSAVVNAEDLEEERIKLGTSMAVSVAGTYAVTAPSGLPIFPTRPSSSSLSQGSSCRRDSNNSHNTDEDVDALVRYFHLDQKPDGESPIDDELKENRMKEQPPVELSCGDRVQVVAIEGKWAKLARGYGYVQADDNRLVKGMLRISHECQ